MKKRIFLGILASTIMIVLVYKGYRYYCDKQLLKEAEVYLNLGDLGVATVNYTKYILMHPDNLEVWMQLANCLLLQGNSDRALDAAQHVEEETRADTSKRELNARANFLLANIYFEKLHAHCGFSKYNKGLIKAAENHMARASRKEELLPNLWYYQAYDDYCDGKRDEALSKFLKLKGEYPDYRPTEVSDHIAEIKNTKSVTLDPEIILNETPQQSAERYFQLRKKQGAAIASPKEIEEIREELERKNKEITETKNKLEKLQSKKTKPTDIIHVGDSRERVKAILGNPDSISDYSDIIGIESWYYDGLGLVTFENGHVKGSTGVKIDPFPRKKPKK